MGFVPTELSHAQIRDADEMIAVPGKGTIIVTVPGLFDPTDAAQVEQVHRVEMQLAHYNLLRVTDPDLRDAPDRRVLKHFVAASLRILSGAERRVCIGTS